MASRKTKKATSTPLVDAALSAELVERPKKDAVTRRREQEEALGGLQTKIFSESMNVVSDYLRAAEVNPMVDPRTPEQDPAYWKIAQDCGADVEETSRVYRIARAGWLPAADCPGFVKVAANMAIGIMKAKATEKGGAHVLNVGRILISESAIPQFEEREVE